MNHFFCFRSRQSNGSWLGCVRPLQENTADLASITLGFTPERMADFDFTSYAIPSENTLILANPATLGGGFNLDWEIDKDPFSIKVWMSTVLILLCMSCAFRSMSANENATFSSPLKDLFRPFPSLLQQDGMHGDSGLTSERITVLATKIFCCITYALYSALLTASRNSASSLPDLSDFGKVYSLRFQLLVVRDSIDEHTLKLSTPGSSAHKLYTERVSTNSYSLVDSVNEAKEKMLNNPKAVFLGYASSFESDQRFIEVPGFKESMVQLGAFALQKDSEFTELFSYHLSHLLEVGLEERAERIWLKKDEAKHASIGPEALSWSTLALPLAFIVLGACTAVLIALVEKRRNVVGCGVQ